MRPFPLLCRLGGLLLLGLFGAACDTAPGPDPVDVQPPTVSDFRFTPDLVNFEQLPPEQQVGERARIPLSLSVRAADPDGRVAEVRYVVQYAQDPLRPVQEGVLALTGPAQYGTAATLELPRSNVGAYTVLVYAVDDEGRLSNQVRGLLRFYASGQPPVVEAVELPARIERPAPGEPDKLLRIVATVRDPDGLANVLRVEMRPNGGAPILLCDDGGQGACGGFSSSGDETAGDGRYTITVRLAASNQPGTNVFDFQAFDRSGLASAVVSRSIIVE